MTRIGAIALRAILLSALAGCGRQSGQEVVVYTSVDQVFSEPIFRAFEHDSGIRVRAVFDTEETKSTGVLNRLLGEADHPRADVFWSGDPVRPLVLVKRGLVSPYVSPAAATIPGPFKAADGMWTGFAARARVLLVNRERVSEGQMPRSVEDLADPHWQGQTAIANPLFGTTTVHMAALFASWGETRARAFLDALKANGVRVASSNGAVRRLVAAGEVAFGLVDTDDAFGALQDGAPVAVVFPDQEGMGTLIMPTTTLLIRGGPHPDTGRRLIDFLLSPGVEERLAETAAHLPLRPGIAPPQGLPPLQDIKAMAVDYGRVMEEMQRIQPWLRAWVGL